MGAALKHKRHGRARPAARNALSGRSWPGINILILWGEVTEQACPLQCWLTLWLRSRESRPSVVWDENSVFE